MAEEFDNYEARLEAARRAVERWETEGGAQATGLPAERASKVVSDSDRTVLPGDLGEAIDRGDGAEE